MTMFMIDKRPGVSIDKEEFESRLGGNIGSIETESDEEMDTLLKDTDYLDLGRSYERFVECLAQIVLPENNHNTRVYEMLKPI